MEARFQYAGGGCKFQLNAILIIGPDKETDFQSIFLNFFSADQRRHITAVHAVRDGYPERHLQSNWSSVQEFMPRQCRIIPQRDNTLVGVEFASGSAAVCAGHEHLLREYAPNDGRHEKWTHLANTMGWCGGERFLVGSEADTVQHQPASQLR